MSDTAAVNLRHKWWLSLVSRALGAPRMPLQKVPPPPLRRPDVAAPPGDSRRRFPIRGTPRRWRLISRACARDRRVVAAGRRPRRLSCSRGILDEHCVVAAGHQLATSVSAHQGAVNAYAAGAAARRTVPTGMAGTAEWKPGERPRDAGARRAGMERGEMSEMSETTSPTRWEGTPRRRRAGAAHNLSRARILHHQDFASLQRRSRHAR